MSLAQNGSTGDEGNTNSSSPKKCSQKRMSGANRWTFTYNNYPSNWMALMAPLFSMCNKWIGGYEIGEENGVPHIQGYCEFKSKVRPVGYQNCPKEVHWGDKDSKSARGTREQNVAYCTKQGNGYEGTLKPARPLPEIKMWGWQRKVVELQNAPPQQRKIYWFWAFESSVGKTNAYRWLAMNGACISGGTAADMKFLICKYKKSDGEYPETVAFNIPRSKQHKIDYAGLEEIVDACFPSTKYECEPVIMPYARVFVFANCPPALNNADMTADRLVVFDVQKYIDEHPEAGPIDESLEPTKKRAREYTDDELFDY